MKSQRAVWGDTLTELGETDKRIVIVDGDLATSTMAVTFAKAHPERFVEAGIAEQNMVGMAFGMSTLGYRPWLSSFGVFLTNRALDQVRMLVSQTKAPVRLAAAYTGLLNGSAGKTHQDIEDFSIMRAMPNMTILAPADAVEAEAMIRWAAEYDGPLYLRLARDAVADVFGADYVYEHGKPISLREGTDAVVVSTGVQTSRTVEAVQALADDGVSVRHIHVPTLKPLDEHALWQHLDGMSRVFTVEEHSVIGGLGDVVSGVLSAQGAGARQTRIGLADGWSESAPNDFLLDKYGLSPARVAASVAAGLQA
ncbi:transketolase family protein [Microbacterium protaetiae]|uniref:Transketolase family protein n=1 Tax=Microbacterium protaetiae TaxID=2509458 RepID=A0A4P6ENZ8_9MICO|nr:transketolase C-terminal domain-containing protein [Microbacterium protaetiae]QAY59648.1 transketolase family protein [Microbacterium protaetiae]